MGYKVDFDALDTLYYSINNKAVEWSEALGGVHESVNNLAASDCITGAGAENIKLYFRSCGYLCVRKGRKPRRERGISD